MTSHLEPEEGVQAGVMMCDVGGRGLSVIVTSRKYSAMPASPAGAGNGMTTLQLAWLHRPIELH